ncbi:hypothetical protein [[Mycoplasma] anseris]|uniref:Transmembrane protein n=1 Tax=[Mycoplasma] anseris TaxID=92400 RepID=A0A2Z4NDN4_9BACT|nr:hypothetical protein [[Mycoplasma] anseris]AWX69515.1 hypothetical protein DP065_01990 [[Mycoplasma] anseris]
MQEHSKSRSYAFASLFGISIWIISWILFCVLFFESLKYNYYNRDIGWVYPLSGVICGYMIWFSFGICSAIKTSNKQAKLLTLLSTIFVIIILTLFIASIIGLSKIIIHDKDRDKYKELIDELNLISRIYAHKYDNKSNNDPQKNQQQNLFLNDNQNNS